MPVTEDHGYSANDNSSVSLHISGDIAQDHVRALRALSPTGLVVLQPSDPVYKIFSGPWEKSWDKICQQNRQCSPNIIGMVLPKCIKDLGLLLGYCSRFDIGVLFLGNDDDLLEVFNPHTNHELTICCRAGEILGYTSIFEDRRGQKLIRIGIGTTYQILVRDLMRDGFPFRVGAETGNQLQDLPLNGIKGVNIVGIDGVEVASSVYSDPEGALASYCSSRSFIVRQVDGTVEGFITELCFDIGDLVVRITGATH